MARNRSTPYLSTERAASALGVSVSTVKRWVDEGLLPAQRTAGGHRKLLRSEVLAFARRSHASATELFVEEPAGDLEAASIRLAEAMKRGRGTEVGSVIRGVYDAGVAIEDLADRVIAPAMGSIGSAWEAGSLDVWHEHRGTQLCADALYALKDDLERRLEKNRPVAVGGAPEGDPYSLATLLAQLVLLDAGWSAVNLGPNMPLASLARSLDELRPRLAWVSLSHLPDRAAFIRTYREFYRAAERLGAAVAVGGRAMEDSVRSAIPYTTHGDGLGHLAAFARTLHPRPNRPRRGRPRAKDSRGS